MVGVTQEGREAFTYQYDYRSRRIGRAEGVADVAIISFSGGVSVQERRVTTGPPSMEFIRGPDQGGGVGGILCVVERAAGNPPTRYYNEYNARGDVLTQRTASQAVSFRTDYRAFGDHTDAPGLAAKGRQRANTKEEDSLTGLLNEGFRYRDILTGSFISRDPAGHVDGPNLYTYVRQNPWTSFDPLGLGKKDIAKVLLKRGLGSVDDLVPNYRRGNDAWRATAVKGAGKDGRATIGGRDVSMPTGTKPGTHISHPSFIDPATGKSAQVYYTTDGFPNFTPWITKVANKQGKQVDGQVKIKMTGDRDEDFRRANEALNIKQPVGFTWHHVEDGETMQLVPSALNNGIAHTGGDAVVRHANGNKNIFEVAEAAPGFATQLASALAPNTAKAIAAGGIMSAGTAKGVAMDAIQNAAEPILIPITTISDGLTELDRKVNSPEGLIGGRNAQILQFLDP